MLRILKRTKRGGFYPVNPVHPVLCVVCARTRWVTERVACRAESEIRKRKDRIESVTSNHVWAGVQQPKKIGDGNYLLTAALMGDPFTVMG